MLHVCRYSLRPSCLARTFLAVAGMLAVTGSGCGNTIDVAKVIRRNPLARPPVMGDLGSEGGALVKTSSSYDVVGASVGGSVKRGRIGISPNFRVTGGIHVGPK